MMLSIFELKKLSKEYAIAVVKSSCEKKKAEAKVILDLIREEIKIKEFILV